MMTVHATPNAFSAGECERIVAATALQPTNDALLVGQNRNHHLRTAELVWMDEINGMGWVMERLIELVRVSNRAMFDFDLSEFAESPQVARYHASNAGHFSWHSDIGDGQLAAKRKLTLVLQLSKPDAYEGGDLEIMPGAQVLGASRSQGAVIVFPSFSLHQVTPVIGGTRHSMTVWAHGPAFR